MRGEGTQTVDLSIIILNWNSVRFLRKCLQSVYSNTTGIDFEVLVLDNASYDGSAILVDAEYPAVRFIQHTENVGFATGNNLAARHAAGKVLLFLNADTEVVGTAVQCMLDCMQSLPDAGSIGPKLLNTDGSIQRTCVQAFPSIMSQFFDAAYLRRLFPSWRLWGNGVLFTDPPYPVPVEGIVGACLMIRKCVFDEAGGFHPGYFMYVEDMDLCYRLRGAGRRNYYLAAASVIHHGGQSSNSQPDKHLSAVMMRESLRIFMRRHRGVAYALLFQASTVLAASCRLSALSVGLLLARSAERKAVLHRAFAKWRRVLHWALDWQSALRQPL